MKNITSELNHDLNNNTNNNDSSSFFDLVIIIFNYCCDIGYVILPSVGYIHQYMKIVSLKKNRRLFKISFIYSYNILYFPYFFLDRKAF